MDGERTLKTNDNLFVFTNEKAGMKEVDKEHVSKVVYDMSKNSSLFVKEQKRLSDLTEKVKRAKKTKNDQLFLLQADQSNASFPLDAILRRFEESRRFDRLILHIDMDMFYAAVAVRDNPSLAGKPIVVGSSAMIATASYEARKFGVRSGMPGFIAKELCSELIFVETDFEAYHKASKQIKNIFRDYDYNFQSMGLDESYLDLTEYCRKREIAVETSGEEIAEEIRRKIYEETKLTASAGIASNHLLAKIASDIRKPNGQYAVPFDAEGVKRFLAPLSVRKIPGVGKVSEKILNEIGVFTCSDILKHARKLYSFFKPKMVEFFLKSAIGISKTTKKNSEQKSFSVDRFFRPTSDRDDLNQRCYQVCFILSQKVGEKNFEGKTITIKLKKANHDLIVRSKTLEKFVFDMDGILPVAMEMMRAELPLVLRSIGVKLSSLRSRVENSLMDYFSDKIENLESLDESDFLRKNGVKKSKKSVRLKQMDLSVFGGGKFQKCPKCEGTFRGLLSLNLHLDSCLD